MTPDPNLPDVVEIRAKRLDSSDVAVSSAAVKAPESPLGQQRQLAGLVRDRFPNAELRSFAEDAATFLDHKVLIVATYRRAEGDSGDAGAADEDDTQQQLFAA